MTATITTATATRTMHLVDLENLVGDPYVDGETAMAVLDRYLELAHRQPGDLVHVAVNPHLALEIGCSTSQRQSASPAAPGDS